MRGSLMFGVLVFVQNFSRAADDLRRQAGQLGHLDAVAAVGSAGLDLTQKDDPAGIGVFPHRDVAVLHALKPVELRQLAVVSEEDSLGAAGGMNVLDDSPGYGQPVIGRSARA